MADGDFIEDFLDEIESNNESQPLNIDIEEQLSSSRNRQLIISFLERRFVEMSATENIEEFCSKLQKQGKSSFLEMREEVLKSFESLTPRPLRLDILQMAIEFVDECIPGENKDDHQNNSSSSNEPFPSSEHSTTSSSTSNEMCTEIIMIDE